MIFSRSLKRTWFVLSALLVQTLWLPPSVTGTETEVTGPIASVADRAAPSITERVAQLRVDGKKPKIVIFWASIGKGHESASQAAEAEIKKLYPEAKIVLRDIKTFQSKWRAAKERKIYDWVTQHDPKGYDRWFRDYNERGAVIESVGDLEVGLRHNPDRVLKWIREQDPSLIISTQNHITEIIAHLRDRGELLTIPTAQILTDYVDTPYFRRLGERVEMSFVPHEKIRQAWIESGTFAPDRVITSGIPVSPEVFKPITEEGRLQFFKKKGLNPTVDTVLMSSGSAGVGDYAKWIEGLTKAREGKAVQIVAICGRSEKNFKALEALKPKLPPNVRLEVYPLIKHSEMLNYLRHSNVILGKTGGLTSTEIAAMGRPAVFLDINGGQEAFNSEFFEKTGMALTTNDQSRAGALVERVLRDPELRKSMLAAQGELRQMIQPSRVAEWVLRQEPIPLSRAANVLAHVPPRRGPIPRASAMTAARSYAQCVARFLSLARAR